MYNKYPDYIFTQFETYYKPFNTELLTFGQNLQIEAIDDLQTERTDFITDGCKLPNGRVAYFGLTTSYNHQFYKPALIIKN